MNFLSQNVKMMQREIIKASFVIVAIFVGINQECGYMSNEHVANRYLYIGNKLAKIFKMSIF